MNTTTTPLRSRALVAGLWLIGAGLLANAAAAWLRPNGELPVPLEARAWGQAAPAAGQMLGARGLFMMPMQLSQNEWGLSMMDVDAQTVWIYRINPSTQRMKLIATRSFRDDRFLEDFNNESPTPREVRSEVSKQRQRQEIENPK